MKNIVKKIDVLWHLRSFTLPTSHPKLFKSKVSPGLLHKLNRQCVLALLLICIIFSCGIICAHRFARRCALRHARLLVTHAQQTNALLRTLCCFAAIFRALFVLSIYFINMSIDLVCFRLFWSSRLLDCAGLHACPAVAIFFLSATHLLSSTALFRARVI